MKKGIKILFIVSGIIVVLGIIGSLVKLDNTATITQQTILKTKLTPELIKEVCREINVYTNYCYEQGISAKTCGEQMYEKLIRIFELTSNQVLEITSNC